MRRILTILFLSLAVVSQGQSILRARIYPYSTSSGYVPVSWDSLGYNVLFKLPVSSLLGSGGSGGGEPVITTPFTTKKYWTGYKTWGSMNSDSLIEGATNLFYTNGRVQTFGDARYLQPSAITGKLNISDTSAMLANYLSGMIARVKYTDTASMLNNYRIGTIANTSNIALKVNISDTGSMLTNYLTGILARVKYTDTASMLNNYRTGMIANTSNISLKVNISDTASMLTNYRTGMLARVKYTDTSAMLANYLTGFLARVKYTDTAAMLANYARAFNYYTKAQIDGSGFLTQNNTITLSGDISGSGQTAINTAIGANKVTLAMMAQVATATFLGRTTAATGNVEALTATQATALLDAFTTSAKGLVPSPGGTSNTTDFLRRDGTWAAPPSGSGFTTADNGLTASTSTNVQLGGDLLKSTFINGTASNFDIGLGISSSKLGQFSVWAASGIQLNGLQQYALSAATDANYTVSSISYYNTLPTITANRTVTMPTGATGKTVVIDNRNTSAFTWTFASTIKDLQGNTITAIPNGSYYNITHDGTDWLIQTILAPNQVALTQIAKLGATAVIGNSTNATGNAQAIGATADGQFLARKGTALNFFQFGGQASMVAASAAINTTETILLSSPSIPASSMQAGTVYRITVYGTCTSSVANASNIRVRLGTAGSTADAVVAVITPTAAATGTSVPFSAVLYVTIRTTGGGTGTTAGYGTLENTGVTGISAAAVVLSTLTTTSALNTTVANIITLTYSSAATTTTSTFQAATIEVVKM